MVAKVLCRLLCCVVILSKCLAAWASEYSLALIKPDAVERGLEDMIKGEVRKHGLSIVEAKYVTFSAEMAREFYAEHVHKAHFPEVLEYITRSPLVALLLEGEECVARWRMAIGPTDPWVAKRERPQSLRAKYGRSLTENSVHGSSPQDAAREIGQLFPEFKKSSPEQSPDGSTSEDPAGRSDEL